MGNKFSLKTMGFLICRYGRYNFPPAKIADRL
jgi:hypothetical protein